jgi:hypothetical protein
MRTVASKPTVFWSFIKALARVPLFSGNAVVNDMNQGELRANFRPCTAG